MQTNSSDYNYLSFALTILQIEGQLEQGISRTHAHIKGCGVHNYLLTHTTRNVRTGEGEPIYAVTSICCSCREKRNFYWSKSYIDWRAYQQDLYTDELRAKVAAYTGGKYGTTVD